MREGGGCRGNLRVSVEFELRVNWDRDYSGYRDSSVC